MTIQLPKQDGATAKVTFQCGISVRFILRYYSNTNQYDLLVAYDPDNERSGYRMRYSHDVCDDTHDWTVFHDEEYCIDERMHRYDVYAYVAENDDSYDICVKLHEIIEHEK